VTVAESSTWKGKMCFEYNCLSWHYCRIIKTPI